MVPLHSAHPANGHLTPGAPKSGTTGVDTEVVRTPQRIARLGNPSAPDPADLCGSNLGNYLVLEPLGRGAMSRVFRGWHPGLMLPVALKVLSPHLGQDPLLRQRFLLEGHVSASIYHPHIVHVFDCREENGLLFLAMEYVHGFSAAELLRTLGRLPVSFAVQLARQAALGLEAAHEKDVVHRDIKPANMLIGRDGRVKIADFGLASLLHPSARLAAMDRFGGVMGTPLYVAPEQAGHAADCDHRADIYSLGATLYHLIAGRPPYMDTSIAGLLLRHARDPIPSLRARLPEVPVEVDTLVSDMLAKDPGLRPQSYAELVDRLAECARLFDPNSTASMGDRLREATPRPPSMAAAALPILV